MADINFDNHPQFFTATILYWKPLLVDDEMKDIVIKSLLFLKNEGSIKVYAFVIMPNHIHLVWHMQDGYAPKSVQQRFMKFTAQQFKFRLIDTGNTQLEQHKVSTTDRQYQFWERNARCMDLWGFDTLTQKINYIHNNPLHDKWRLVDRPSDYRYSSAKFYETGFDEFGLLFHYNG